MVGRADVAARGHNLPGGDGMAFGDAVTDVNIET